MMDEDSNHENSNSSAKRSKLDISVITIDDSSSTSNSDEVDTTKSTLKDNVTGNTNEAKMSSTVDLVSVKSQKEDESTTESLQNKKQEQVAGSSRNSYPETSNKSEQNEGSSKGNGKIRKQKIERKRFLSSSSSDSCSSLSSNSIFESTPETTTETNNLDTNNEDNQANFGLEMVVEVNPRGNRMVDQVVRQFPFDFDTSSAESNSTYSSDEGSNLYNLGDYDDSISDSTDDCEKDAVKKFLSKTKPKYNWSSVHEIMNRERGLSGIDRNSMIGRNAYSFQSRFYSARHTVEKLKMLHNLESHEGCVNSLNFNRSGSLLVSGSDDLSIIIWDWADKKVKFEFNSEHNSNVFQTKFLEFSSDLKIISSGRDGLVRLATVPPSGSIKPLSEVLIKHSSPVHKIASNPQSPYEVLTAGEDGHVIRLDLRDPQPECLVTLRHNKRRVPLFSVAHHPLEPQFCICGRDQFVHVYDKRKLNAPFQMMCPKRTPRKHSSLNHITCAVYNATGTEILASYSDDDIYLFNNKSYKEGEFIHCYRGHENKKTIKGVNFFGLNSEYIISGSDCGYFFIWDKETETIINWICGDRHGVVNCIEPHPTIPVLATSGLDPDVKIWIPSNSEYPPPMTGLAKCFKNNSKRRNLFDDLFEDRALFFLQQYLRTRNNTSEEHYPHVHDLVSASSSDDDDDDDDDNDEAIRSRSQNSQFQRIPCSPQ